MTMLSCMNIKLSFLNKLYIWFLFFLFSQFVWAEGEQREFRQFLTEKNLKSYTFLYKGKDENLCFLDPNIYQTADKSDNLIKLLNKISLLCDFSKEEVIQKIVQNTNIGKSDIEVIAKQGGGYFSTSGEVVPAYEFPVMTAGVPAITSVIAWFAGVPPSSVIILSVATVASITNSYFHPENILQQINWTISVGQLLLKVNRELTMLWPLKMVQEGDMYWNPESEKPLFPEEGLGDPPWNGDENIMEENDGVPTDVEEKIERLLKQYPWTIAKEWRRIPDELDDYLLDINKSIEEEQR